MLQIFSLFLFVLCFNGSDSLSPYPVILIPGDGGNQIEAKLNKTEVVHYICSKVSDWFLLWLNAEQLLPSIIDCWADNMKLLYDNKSRTTSNNDGVQIRIPGFGNTSSVEFLDTSEKSFSIYFANLVKFLLPLGYSRGVNIHGAPYDFRKAANENEEYFINLKELIEKTYQDNQNVPVILLGHSMGCSMSLIFLQRQTKAWKDKYIRAFISLAGVWGGTVRAMKVFAIGDDLGSWIVSGKSLMVEQRSSPSLAWLMPSNEFWSQDDVFVATDKKNFTLQDFKDFYYDLQEYNAYEIFKDVRDLNKGLKAPDVEVFCLHGTGVPTTQKLLYSPGSWPSGTPTLEMGDGDGTVNLQSLLGCTRWTNTQSKSVHHHTFNATDHLQILRLDEPTQFIVSIIHSLNEENRWKETPIIDIAH